MNRKLYVSGLALAVGVGWLGIGGASASPFTNGSFENGIDTGGSFVTVAGGNNTSITGWTVGGDSVDYIGGYWTAEDLARSIDLNGNGQGSISQTFDVVNGQQYVVDFWLAGNPDGPPDLKTLGVSAAVGTQTYTFDASGTDRVNMGWVLESFSFVAVGTTATLSFDSLTPDSPYGPALDNVTVSAVPIPPALALFGSGLAGVGFLARRRKRLVNELIA